MKTSSNLKNKSINLRFLQFKSFKLNKKINNLIEKNSKNTLKEEIIKKNLYEKFKHIYFHVGPQHLNCKKFHQYGENETFLFWKILKNCHPDTYDDIHESFFQNAKRSDVKIFQFHVNQRVRCVFFVINDVIYPILLDLKHCICPSKYNFDNNINHEDKPWSFENEKEQLKDYLLSFDKNRKKV